MSWECTGHTTTCLRPGRPVNRVSIAWARDVSIFHIIQTDSEAHPGSYSTSTNVASFHVVKKAGAWTWPFTAILWICYHGVHKRFTFDLGIKIITRNTACKILQTPKHRNNYSFSEVLNSSRNTRINPHRSDIVFLNNLLPFCARTIFVCTNMEWNPPQNFSILPIWLQFLTYANKNKIHVTNTLPPTHTTETDYSPSAASLPTQRAR